MSCGDDDEGRKSFVGGDMSMQPAVRTLNNPTHPTNPASPTNPAFPTNPTYPDNPTKATNPTNPTNPTHRYQLRVCATPPLAAPPLQWA
jgi:hypothetical protein